MYTYTLEVNCIMPTLRNMLRNGRQFLKTHEIKRKMTKENYDRKNLLSGYKLGTQKSVENGEIASPFEGKCRLLDTFSIQHISVILV